MSEPTQWWADPDPEEADFRRWYGAWSPLDPAGAAALMQGFDRPWWVVGGWAIEAFTGVAREHEDIDLSILACDVPALRAHLVDWTVWSNHGGVLRPLSDRFPEPLDVASQLWIRRDARAPWVVDLPLTPDSGGRWTNKRLPGHELAVEEVTWVDATGLRHLAPEIVLHYKAALHRPKDDADLAAAWPLLGAEQRAWLRAAVEATHPDHPWLERLAHPAGS